MEINNFLVILLKCHSRASRWPKISLFKQNELALIMVIDICMSYVDLR